MHKSEYFVEAFKLRRYCDRRWCLRVMGLPTQPYSDDQPMGINWDGTQFLVTMPTGNKEPLEGAEAGKPLFPIKEKFTIPVNCFPNVLEPLETNYGTAIWNAVVTAHPFQGKIPYINTRENGKFLDNLIEQALKNKVISVSEYLLFRQAMEFTTGFTQVSVVAATPATLGVPKAVLELRDQLIEKYKDQLHDPAIIARIEEECTKLDKKLMADDPAAKFILKGKGYGIVRKKMYVLQGGVARMDDPSQMEFIPTSLADGTRPEDMPAIVNSLRDGSYGRGQETQKGGESAKFSNRIYQNTRIDGHDCGTQVGLLVPFTKDNAGDYVGRWLVGATKSLTAEDVAGLVGKSVVVRGPQACKTSNGNYCERCIGDQVTFSKVGIGPQMAAVGSVFLSIALSSFHGKELVTVQCNPEEVWT